MSIFPGLGLESVQTNCEVQLQGVNMELFINSL